jgi:hypothetical protein
VLLGFFWEPSVEVADLVEGVGIRIEGDDRLEEMPGEDPNPVGKVWGVVLNGPNDVSERSVNVVFAMDIETTNRAAGSSGGKASGIGSPSDSQESALASSPGSRSGARNASRSDYRTLTRRAPALTAGSSPSVYPVTNRLRIDLEVFRDLLDRQERLRHSPLRPTESNTDSST